jgi:hypothetical protein
MEHTLNITEDFNGVIDFPELGVKAHNYAEYLKIISDNRVLK